MKETFLLDKITPKEDKLKKISVGDNHCIILFNSGKIAVFGDNSNGQLGISFKKGDKDNNRNELVMINPDLNNDNIKNYEIIDIACGQNFSLLLISANSVNYLYKFGFKQEDRYRDDIDEVNPINLINLKYDAINIKNIFAFGQRSLFYTYKDEIYVGEIDFKMNPINKYKHFHTMTRHINTIAIGSEHCLILDVDGNLFAIGDNTYGEIGIEDSLNSDKVKEIKFFKDNNSQISKISVGARHSLVLLKNGELYAFGDNSDGQCTGFSIRYTSPTRIIFENKEKIIETFCGYNHCMILLANGDIYTWGDNTSGKLTLREGAQNINTPKILQILKGKNINYLVLGFQMSILSTSSLKNSIISREKI